ncbi:MAG TPA: family 1 glycosylhydrolase [Steroidobacteraceae bacterium]|jgi:dTDP-4-dehydrorhamnose reductase|nr:family 1 glycosylhydrolase [Steroidobacteraceae bacterium]
MDDIAIWGGVECSVNRIGDRWYDQLELSGHAHRLADLELIADLGIRTLRYPVLWERTAPDSSSERDWRWADERLRKLRFLSIDPIVGLVHHGSGPRYTGLIEENFAPELARFAADVAARYPWVNRYTPINEPLTTARFSTLYGHWYPHHRNERSFARALLNQCRAISLSMKAIRNINPAAELVQTEDLGTTYGTPHMGYQQRFDNERRWLSWDLLCGRVDTHHPLRPFLEDSGITADELDWFVTNPCPPQILGINHYVTSDRYLDERLALYPSHAHGHNSRERYADIDAVRVVPQSYPGWNVIKAASARYQLPIALTEVHMGCTREEQLRWFQEAWRAASKARMDGCDVRALTTWSIFGAYNWDTLLTRTDGSYECGAFDVRASKPRPTAIARLIRTAISWGEPLETHFDLPGWWQRPEKVLYGAVPEKEVSRDLAQRRPNSRPILICGANGSLGRALIHACEKRSLKLRALSRADLDVTNSAAVNSAVEAIRPWAIINAAGYVRVDEAERHSAECIRDNLRGPQALAAAAHNRRVTMLTFSSDLVFDGQNATPYLESSVARPLNVYGMSKRASEVATLAYPSTLCVRTAAFFGAWHRGDFLSDALLALSRGRKFVALDDVTVSPTYLPDLAQASLDLLIDGCTGLLHLANSGAVTWANFLARGAEALGIDTRNLERRGLAELKLPAPRPLYSALASERVCAMPTLEDAIGRYASAASKMLGDHSLQKSS